MKKADFFFFFGNNVFNDRSAAQSRNVCQKILLTEGDKDNPQPEGQSSTGRTVLNQKDSPQPEGQSSTRRKVLNQTLAGIQPSRLGVKNQSLDSLTLDDNRRSF